MLFRSGDSTFVEYLCYNIGSNFPLAYPVYSSTGTYYPDCVDTSFVTRTIKSTAPTDSCPGICGTLETTEQAFLMEKQNQLNKGAIEMDAEVLRLYPNPTSTLLKLEALTQGRVKMLDMNGREVMPVFIVHKGVNQIDISSLSAGEYIVQYTSAQTTSVGRFVKQ